MKCTWKRDTTVHEIFFIVSRFPRYIILYCTSYVAENRLPLGQCTKSCWALVPEWLSRAKHLPWTVLSRAALVLDSTESWWAPVPDSNASRWSLSWTGLSHSERCPTKGLNPVPDRAESCWVHGILKKTTQNSWCAIPDRTACSAECMGGVMLIVVPQKDWNMLRPVWVELSAVTDSVHSTEIFCSSKIFFFKFGKVLFVLEYCK